MKQLKLREKWITGGQKLLLMDVQEQGVGGGGGGSGAWLKIKI